MDQRSDKKNSGFTLIEVLIVVAILGILMSIAVPAYSEYIRRAHRAAAQQFLLDVAQRQEQYLLDNRQYATALRTAGAPLGAGELDMTFPADISPYYNNPDFTGVNNAATPPAFLLFMSPKAGKMSGDGNLVINNATQKWRDTNGDNAYTAGTDKPW
ncbi:type IV pilin protein [Accumulibacter sp.]|jgi:type IV pilus assembly protein PilE|uniref:General secretion pathway protein H n=1 Tax=Accumulibacter regalis TaxID=522306 RepID=C7RP47_ACCRE|nr:type IV pilin protein [Accumulibacter sp.]MBN8497734.1 prepilin-type N-terminal cleavage/methylation domain-containing protein [Accumulibacter sp.]MBO3715468.1 prepilin-type N-terminal cleavage/methylation domain-containing protein [Accumulibacter sp.]